ncbi:MAG TPA: parallel beta-helix domain-containing protein [Novosphingobium sp.]|nr:parallel beta-helix domain-containing protein [Novosphingobium sp. UBA6272]HQV04039.1 parallel beta-helix domain-containing protein [Novosphingobium sp.]
MSALLIAAATALALAAPAHAKTIAVAAGEGAQGRLQEALIIAAPGDVVELGAGRFVLTDGLSLDVKGVTVRGAGMDATVLDFSAQKGAGEGLLVTSDEVTLRDFAVENTKGDGIKSKGADNIVYYRLRVTWTGGPKETNGAYGIYPVSSTGVLVDGCKVSGASDAGIYVGQSKAITVRYNYVEQSVAGIEIENSRGALVTGNLVTRNTGGILVFDLPNLPVMGGGNVLIEDNVVSGNDTPNFAPKGNIVAGVPRGTGIMIMANENVEIIGNSVDGNPTAAVMIVAYPLAYKDARYNPLPRKVRLVANRLRRNGYDPQLPGAPALLAAFGGSLPNVMWDGLGDMPQALTGGLTGWTLNLPKQGASPEQARPAPFKLPDLAPIPYAPRPGAPQSVLDRIAR